MTQPTTTPCRRTVTCFVALLLIVATSYASAGQPRGDGAAWTPAPEIAPLAPPLTHQTDRKDRALARHAIAEPDARLHDEVFGGETDLVGGVPAGCAAGGSDVHSAERHQRPLLDKLRKLHQRLKDKRLNRRAARIHRRATTPFLERIGHRRRAH